MTSDPRSGMVHVNISPSKPADNTTHPHEFDLDQYIKDQTLPTRKLIEKSSQRTINYWVERWFGSGPERGWWIYNMQPYPGQPIAYLGDTDTDGERARTIVKAHNTALSLEIQPVQSMCQCGDRPIDQCPGEWEPGCDLGNNPKYASVAPVAMKDYRHIPNE